MEIKGPKELVIKQIYAQCIVLDVLHSLLSTQTYP